MLSPVPSASQRTIGSAIDLITESCYENHTWKGRL